MLLRVLPPPAAPARPFLDTSPHALQPVSGVVFAGTWRGPTSAALSPLLDIPRFFSLFCAAEKVVSRGQPG